jgi:hypothetical protein
MSYRTVRWTALFFVTVGFWLGFWRGQANATVVHSEHPEPFQTWVNESQVPGPDEVNVYFGSPKVHAAVPFNIYWWDYYPGSTEEQWRSTFLHEVGHVFNFMEMRAKDYWRYVHIYRPRLRRHVFFYFNMEQFADDYAACAIGQLTNPQGYHFPAPTWRQHNRICKLIRWIGKRESASS